MKPDPVLWLLIAILCGSLLLFCYLVSAAFSFDVAGPEIVADDQVNQFRIDVHTIWWTVTENSGIDEARHDQYRRLLREVGARGISKDKSTPTIKVPIGYYGMVGSGLAVFYYWCPDLISSMQRVRSFEDLPPGEVASVSLADDWFVLYER